MKYQREAFERDEEERDNISHDAEKDSTRPEFKTMGGRMVYGGGGITPDYIVKSDRLNGIHRAALRSRLVFLQFADQYLELHGEELRASYGKSSADFAEDFEVTPDMLKDLQEIAKAKNIEFNKELYEKDLRYVKAFAKASYGAEPLGERRVFPVDAAGGRAVQEGGSRCSRRSGTDREELRGREITVARPMLRQRRGSRTAAVLPRGSAALRRARRGLTPRAPPLPRVLMQGEELVYNVRYGSFDLGQIRMQDLRARAQGRA